jgi:hypothetical protein
MYFSALHIRFPNVDGGGLVTLYQSGTAIAHAVMLYIYVLINYFSKIPAHLGKYTLVGTASCNRLQQVYAETARFLQLCHKSAGKIML